MIKKDFDLAKNSKSIIDLEDISSSFYKQGRYDEVENILRQLIKLKEISLGPYSPQTLISVNNLGSCLGRLRKYDEAERLFRHVLEIRSKVLDVDNIETLITVDRLGIILKYQFLFDEAEKCFTRALLGFEKKLGLENIYTAETAYNYAVLCIQMGKRFKAKTLFEKSYFGISKHHGIEHPHCVDTFNWVKKCENDILIEQIELNRRSSIEFNEDNDIIEKKTSNEIRKNWICRPSCRVCKSLYSFLNREHHCRICSKSICNNCSKNNTYSLEFASHLVKCCDICIRQGF